MTLEDKELLLKDLCARLPYGVKCGAVLDDGTYGGLFRLSDELNSKHLMFNDIPYAVRPYLRPMSSMAYDESGYYNIHIEELSLRPNVINAEELITWLIENHFDYHGLIEKGLALEAPEGMYKTE